jgi:hypothetical protein
MEGGRGMNYKTALAEQIDDMAESLEYWKDAHKRAMDKEVDLQQELADSLLTNAELSVEIKQLKEEV